MSILRFTIFVKNIEQPIIVIGDRAVGSEFDFYVGRGESTVAQIKGMSFFTVEDIESPEERIRRAQNVIFMRQNSARDICDERVVEVLEDVKRALESPCQP